MADNSSPCGSYALGIDVGGSGIKGAIVDLNSGTISSERIRIDTPQPATPEAVAEVIAEITRRLDWSGCIGITVPSVVQQQTTRLAPNIDKAWIGCDCSELFSRFLPDRDISVLNDADAAGLAEMHYGAAQDKDGLIVLLTFGTGIGSAVIYNGVLVPNTEFGHFELHGDDCEHYASAAVRTREELSIEQWAKRVDEMLHGMEKFFWPDLIIVGGGISRKHDQWVPLLTNRTPILPAQLRNDAGIVGAAYAASQQIKP